MWAPSKTIKGNTELFRFSSSSKDKMTLEDCCAGMLVLGHTGGGKTSAMRTVASRFVEAGMGGVVFCAKAEEFDDWVKLCKVHGREGDLVNFAKESFNFITHEARSGDNAIENLVSILTESATAVSKDKGGARDDTWITAAKQLVRSLLTILWAAKGEILIGDIYSAITSMPSSLEQVQNDAEWKNTSFLWKTMRSIKDSSPDVLASIQYVTAEWPTWAPQTSSSVAFTLSGMVDFLRRSPLKERLCSETTITPDDCRKGKIIVLNLPVLALGQVGRIAQVLFKISAQTAFQRKTDGLPVFFWVDECQYFCSPNDTMFQSTARSSRTATVYLTQNLPTLYQEAGGSANGEQFVKGLAGNLATKVFCVNGEEQSNQWAADLIGKEMLKSTSRSRSFGRSRGTSVTINQQLDHVVRPIEFTRLKHGRKENGYIVTAVVYRAGAVWSNGKTWLKVKFNQRYLTHGPGDAPVWGIMIGGILMAAVVWQLQAVGIVPFPSYIRFPKVVRWEQVATAMNWMRVHLDLLYPVIAGTLCTFFLWCQNKRCAR